MCLFDPKYNIGGMNHFMLPNSATSQAQCATYGIHAMELLINDILRRGGRRDRLEARLFGGAPEAKPEGEAKAPPAAAAVPKATGEAD